MLNWFDKLEAFLIEIIYGDKHLQIMIDEPIKTIDPDIILPWTTKENCRHNCRALADLEGLTVAQKNLMSQVIHCESNYNPACVHPNVVAGVVTSTDYGICQWNDFYHGSEISSHDALNNPEKAVRLMCAYIKDGRISQWVCYSKSMYIQYTA